MKTYECFHHHARIINDCLYRDGESPPHLAPGDKIHDAEGHDEFIVIRRLVSGYDPPTVVGGYDCRIDYFCGTPEEYARLNPDEASQTYDDPERLNQRLNQPWTTEELDELRELLAASRQRERDLIEDRDAQLQIATDLQQRLTTANGLLVRSRDVICEVHDLLHEATG